MEFRVLGPVAATHDDGSALALGPPMQRRVLGLLLCQPNATVSTDRMIDTLWGEHAGHQGDPRKALQVYVHRLRRALGPDQRILHRAPGYTLRLEPGECDAVRFEESAERGGSALADGQAERASGLLREALSLWRGQAFADMADLPVVREEAARLEDRRLAVVELSTEAELRLGRHADLVAGLRVLVERHPLRERLRGQLMLALYRSGRQHEALNVFQEGRRTLAEELGLEPGKELRRLERDILERSSRLEPPRTGLVTAGLRLPPPVRPPAPSQLPPAIADFTGRSKELDGVIASLAAPDPETLRIVAVTGRAGIGKTTLAVQAAHRMLRAFPDGQLYADLDGLAAEPLAPGEVLGRFLRGLGETTIPEDLAERAALYRSRLAGRRILVLLDNVASAAQVRPLLPGTAQCAVMILSRARLLGLAGAEAVDLDVFTAQQATELLGRVIGAERVAREQDEADRLTSLCGLLPLAVRIIGSRLAARPGLPLSWVADRLGDESRRLDELAAGDLEVRAGLALTYRALPPVQRRAFRLLGLLEIPDFPVRIAAAVCGLGTDETEQVIDALVGARLLELAGMDTTGRARYRFHDLIRLYAREQARAEESEAERSFARARVRALRPPSLSAGGARCPAGATS